MVLELTLAAVVKDTLLLESAEVVVVVVEDRSPLLIESTALAKDGAVLESAEVVEDRLLFESAELLIAKDGLLESI
jgi:hypothetical protein